MFQHLTEEKRDVAIKLCNLMNTLQLEHDLTEPDIWEVVAHVMAFVIKHSSKQSWEKHNMLLLVKSIEDLLERYEHE